MKNRVVKSLVLVFFVVSLVFLAGCGESLTRSDTKYWFSANTRNFIAYDETAGNLDEAGSYWNFTAARSGSVTMSVRIDTDNYTSAAYLYVNDVQVQSESVTGIYSYVWQFDMQKGDKIVLHAFWVNGLWADDTGFTISTLVMNDGSGDFILTEFGSSATA